MLCLSNRVALPKNTGKLHVVVDKIAKDLCCKIWDLMMNSGLD